MKDIENAVEILHHDGVIIFPTDTVFGIGCRIDRPNAIMRVFTIRKRNANKPVLVLVNSLSMAQKYLLPIPPIVKSTLIRPFWPGKLTIILPCSTKTVPTEVRAGKNTLGVRQTNHYLLLQLLARVKVPIIAPSANFSGDVTPSLFDQINPKLIATVDYVLRGSCMGEKPSTIIDCSMEPWKLIREGAIPRALLNKKGIIVTS